MNTCEKRGEGGTQGKITAPPRPPTLRSVGEEGGGFAEEEVELIVVHPVAGAGNLEQAALRDGLVARIFVRKRQKAFESPEEQRGAGDLAEQFDRLFPVVAVLRTRPCIII